MQQLLIAEIRTFKFSAKIFKIALFKEVLSIYIQFTYSIYTVRSTYSTEVQYIYIYTVRSTELIIKIRQDFLDKQ